MFFHNFFFCILNLPAVVNITTASIVTELISIPVFLGGVNVLRSRQHFLQSCRDFSRVEQYQTEDKMACSMTHNGVSDIKKLFWYFAVLISNF